MERESDYKEVYVVYLYDGILTRTKNLGVFSTAENAERYAKYKADNKEALYKHQFHDYIKYGDIEVERAGNYISVAMKSLHQYIVKECYLVEALPLDEYEWRIDDDKLG